MPHPTLCVYVSAKKWEKKPMQNWTNKIIDHFKGVYIWIYFMGKKIHYYKMIWFFNNCTESLLTKYWYISIKVEILRIYDLISTYNNIFHKNKLYCITFWYKIKTSAWNVQFLLYGTPIGLRSNLMTSKVRLY